VLWMRQKWRQKAVAHRNLQRDGISIRDLCTRDVGCIAMAFGIHIEHGGFSM
jgi:hypothetical protein